MKPTFQYLSTIVIMACLCLTQLACGKTKALQNIREADELSAKLLIYGRNIARANNDSFDQKNIPASLHLATNKAADIYIKGVEVFLASIASAKQAVKNGGDPVKQMDLVEAAFNANVVNATTALIGAVATFPPGVAGQIAGWAGAIELALQAFRLLIADTRIQLQGVNANA